MDIIEGFDVEVIKITEDVRLWYRDNGSELDFFIAVGDNVQRVSKNFYINVKSLDKYPVARGKIFKAVNDDGELVYLYDDSL